MSSRRGPGSVRRLFGVGFACCLWLGCAGAAPRSDGPDRAPAAEASPAAGGEARLPEPERGAPAHVLLIGITGLTPDRLGPEGPFPRLSAMAAAGAVADGLVPAAPATPGVAHATLLTGRSPASHGLGGDHRLGPNGASAELVREASAVRGPTLWSAARGAGLLTAGVGWPTSVGAAADWLLPEIHPTRRGESWPALLEGVATPSLAAWIEESGAAAPEAGFPGPVRDRMLTEVACHVLTGEAAPRLLLLRWSQAWPQLARFGPDSEEARAAFAQVDRELARLMTCLAGSGALARSAFFVAGDGPVRPVHTRIQANVALEAAGLLVPAADGSIRRWEAVARAAGGSALVYADDEEAALLARRALAEAAEWSGAFRIVPAEELLALGADRRAWFGLEALPGHRFAEGLAERQLLLPARTRGAAGSFTPAEGFPHRTAFVAWGAGVRPALRIPEMRQIDVAPTVAYALGVVVPEAEGRALVGVVTPPSVAGGRGGR